MPFRKRRFLALALVLASAFCAAGFFRPLLIERIERQVFDSRMLSLPGLSPGDSIVIISVGEKSLESLGRWPWSRVTHARLLGRLGEAKAILLDILFPEESDPVGDSVLAEVARVLGNTVVAMHFIDDGSGKDRALLPYHGLLSAAKQMGFTNVTPDIDGLFRYYTPFRKSGDALVPSFSVAALPLILGERPRVEDSSDGGYLVTAGNSTLPVDGSGRLWIRFSREPFPEYEYVDVLEGKIPPEIFRGRIVLIGAAAAGIDDYVMAPIAGGITAIPGVRFHAEALNTLLNGGIPRRVPPEVDGIMALILSVTGVLLAGFCRPRSGIILAASVFIAAILATGWIFVYTDWWLATITPVVALVVSFMTVLYVRFRVLHRDWEIKTLSIGSIYDLMISGLDSVQEFGDYLHSIWPSVERDLGMKLLASPLPPKEAKLMFGENKRKVLKPGEVIVARGGSQSPFNRMLVQTSRDTKTGVPSFTLVGWDAKIPEEQVKSVAVWIMSSSWFYSVLKESERDRQLLFDTIRAMMAALDAKDPATAGHSERVAELSTWIAEKLGLDKNQVDAVALGSVIHDVGKIGIPDRILAKEGPLTDEEYAIVKEHSSIGGKILESVALPESAQRAVENHHERIDGSGYPKGLSGDEIDIASRIVSVADVFDALLSDRPYRKSWTIEEACSHMHSKAGSEFDEEVVRILLEIKAPPGWVPPE